MSTLLVGGIYRMLVPCFDRKKSAQGADKLFIYYLFVQTCINTIKH